MDWYARPVGMNRDPVLRGLSPAARDFFWAAMDDAAEHETDGCLIHPGPGNKLLRECLAAGALSEREPGVYVLHRWGECMPSVAALVARSDSARDAARMRWASDPHSDVDSESDSDPHSEPHAERRHRASKSESGSKPLVGSENLVLQGLEGPQLLRLGGRSRDEAYEAFGDWWLGKWRGLPRSSRGRINEALAELRYAHRDDDIDLAAEITVRGARARTWRPEWAWTPQTLVRWWPKLDHDVAPDPPKNARSVANILALAQKAKEAEEG